MLGSDSAYVARIGPDGGRSRCPWLFGSFGSLESKTVLRTNFEEHIYGRGLRDPEQIGNLMNAHLHAWTYIGFDERSNSVSRSKTGRAFHRCSIRGGRP